MSVQDYRFQSESYEDDIQRLQNLTKSVKSMFHFNNKDKNNNNINNDNYLD